MPSISVPGGKVFYDLYSSDYSPGNPWLVIYPGMAMPSGAYQELSTLLSSKFRVIVINHRGIKPSNASLPRILTLRKVHDDSTAIFAKHGIKRCHVIGESYGGMLAMSLAEYFPEIVDSIFVVNSSLAGNRQFRLSPRTILASCQHATKNRHVWGAIAESIFSPGFKDKNSAKFSAWLQSFGNEPFPTRTALAQGFAAGLYHGRGLSTLKTPTYIVYGESDLLVDPINSIKIHRKIPRSHLISLPDVGHHACGEAPAQLADLVKRLALS